MPDPSVREQLLQAARSWVKATLTLSDAKVRLPMREEKAPRGELPYYVVDLVSFDRTQGVDEFLDKTDGVRTDKGQREATLRIVGYGEDAEEGLQTLGLLSHRFPDEAYCRSLSPVIDISAIESTTWEHRYSKDFALTYTIIHDSTAAPGAESFHVTVDEIEFDVPTL